MIDEQNFFDQLIKNNLRTYNIRNIAIGQGDDYTTSCLLDLSKHQVLNADLRAIQQINFTEVNVNNNTTMCFIIEETKETILDFSQGIVRVL